MKVLVLSDDEADAVQELLTMKLEDQRDEVQGILDYLKSEQGTLDQLIEATESAANDLHTLKLLADAARRPWVEVNFVDGKATLVIDE
jgi:hypothetical protein